MCTGVRSAVELDSMPNNELLEAMAQRDGLRFTLKNLSDGRVHVSCFAPIDQRQSDLPSALRKLSTVVRSDLAELSKF
jgi:acylphosphatase